MIISSGPLQGITDDVFRKVHHQIFGGVDRYFGPYIRLEKNKPTKSSQIRDISSVLNKEIPFVPQILSNNPDLIIEEIKRQKLLGNHEINWNLGCPYPMVTNRKMGSGLLNQPQIIHEILQKVYSESNIQFSIKCRLGYESENEIYPLLEVFNQFDLKEVIIHARTAKQMYKGFANPEKLLSLFKLSKHPIAYNGDINTYDDFIHIKSIFGDSVKHYMIGRGLISNPNLAFQIKNEGFSENSQVEKWEQFHQQLIIQYEKRYQSHQLLPKMRGLWEYLSLGFVDAHQVFKLIKKTKNWSTYLKNTNTIFHQFDLNG
jgi:tRNA-dihydrouridine synthase B